MADGDQEVRPREQVQFADVEPLFKALSLVVRTLSLGKAQLSFRPQPSLDPSQAGSTQVRGTLFGAFQVDGVVTLEAADPRGELTLHFGCKKGENAPQKKKRNETAEQSCDLPLESLLPELMSMGVLSASKRFSGELKLAFGRSVGLRPLWSGPPGSPPAALPPLPYLATLRLWRALVTVKSADDEGAA